MYKQLFHEIIEGLHNYKQIYTDASKTEKGSGIAILTPNSQLTQKINNNCSIYTAEVLAIHSAIKYIRKQQQSDNYVILSDSLSSVTSLMNNKKRTI